MRISQSQNRIDPSFEKNYKGLRYYGIRIGVYKYSYALNESQAREEAEKVLELLAGRPLDFPVFYDLEWSRQRALGSASITRIVKAFRRIILDGGYLFGIYCNTDWYYHVLDTKSLPYDYWLSAYPYNDRGTLVESLRPPAYPYNDRGTLVESLRPPVGIGWQYSSKGQVPGISGNVDLDVFYKTYPVRPESNGSPCPEHDNPKPSEYFLYTIQSGDTLTAIAKRYNTTVQKLAELNHISDPDLIYTGTSLKIPR